MGYVDPFTGSMVPPTDHEPDFAEECRAIPQHGGSSGSGQHQEAPPAAAATSTTSADTTLPSTSSNEHAAPNDMATMGIMVPHVPPAAKKSAFKRSLSRGTVVMDISSPPKAPRTNHPSPELEVDDDALARELETLMEEASQFGPTFHAAADSDYGQSFT